MASKRTSGRNPAARHTDAAHWREVVPAGSRTHCVSAKSASERRGGGRHHEEQRVVGEWGGIEVAWPGRGVAGIALCQNEIQIASAEARDGDLRLQLTRLHPQARVRGRQRLDKRRDVCRHRALEGGDPHRPGQRREGSGHVGLSVVEHLQDAFNVTHEHERLRGEPNAAPVRLQQRDSDLLLQLRELLRDGRRAVGERFRHRGQGAAVAEFAQDAEPAKVIHRGFL